MLCGPFLLLVLLWIVASIRSGVIHWSALSICLGAVLAWFIWLNASRLDIADQEFSYASLFTPRRSVLYTSVTNVNVNRRGLASHNPLGVSLLLSDGSHIPVNFKVFPREAKVQLMERIRK